MPLEPVVRRTSRSPRCGPIVMNTGEEIRQAVRDGRPADAQGGMMEA